MAIEQTQYLTYAEAVFIHIMTMRSVQDERCGSFARTLVESALARPQHAAVYESADLVRQAATLCFGLSKNHPWLGGNKRTATAITNEFLKLNGYRISAPVKDVLELVYSVEAERWLVDEIEVWLRKYVIPK